jgi:hypothetical protein
MLQATPYIQMPHELLHMLAPRTINYWRRTLRTQLRVHRPHEVPQDATKAHHAVCTVILIKARERNG